MENIKHDNHILLTIKRLEKSLSLHKESLSDIDNGLLVFLSYYGNESHYKNKEECKLLTIKNLKERIKDYKLKISILKNL
jgi:NifU-like protein involved in Fe-S cluster formation